MRLHYDYGPPEGHATKKLKSGRGRDFARKQPQKEINNDYDGT
jgi:hypothetical protein